ITAMTFLEKFEQLAADGVEELLYLSINSTGSATNSNAQAARAMFLDEHPDSTMEIAVVDSHTYSMAYGIFVLMAAKKMQNGAELCDTVSYLVEQFQKVEIILSVHSLKIIKKSGRVSAAAAFAGELMGLRPIITLIQGKTQVIRKVRGDAKILPTLCEHLTQHAAERTPYLIGGTRGIADKHGDARSLSKLCEKAMGYPPALTFSLGAAITSNTGTDAIAIVYLNA
ncbi:MAG: DegV family protein, partial [Pygmaiobacter sp.]